MRISVRRRWRGDSGAAAVEFALVLPILLLLVFGIIQYGLYFWAMQTGTNATGEALRRLSVGDCENHTDLETLLKSRIGFAAGNGSSVSASVAYTSADPSHSTIAAPGQIGGTVKITVSFNALDMHLPFIDLPNGGNITRHLYAMVEDVTPTTDGCHA